MNAVTTPYAWLYRSVMRRARPGLLLMLVLLAACAAPGEESPASTATQVPASATVETPTRPTTAPSTETAVVQQTKPTATLEGPSTGETPTSLQEQLGLPAGTAIALHQTGGFAGVDNLWIFYDDGRIDTPTGEQISVTEAAVGAQLAALDAAGFFEIEQPKQKPICCDHFVYMLYAGDGERENVITISGGDPDLAPELLEIIQALQTMATGDGTA